MKALRVFAALAAAFLVAAVALGSMLPADQPLGAVLAGIDDTTLPRLQTIELHRLGVWAWAGITVPLLERPAWFAPLALGIICLGTVASLHWLLNDKRPRRRRS